MSELVSFESFDIEKTYEYILSIQVSLDGFSFSVLSNQGDKTLAYKYVPLKISNTSLIPRRFDDWWKSENLIQRPFKKIRIIIFSEKFTLIPEDYFHDTLKQEIPQLLFEKDGESEIVANIIGKLKTRLMFALPAGLNSVITKQIGECEIIHPVKIVLNNLPETEKENGMILLFDAKYFYTILFNKNKVILANSFKMTHTNDVIYYVLTTLKQMEIAAPATNLFVANTHKLPKIKESLQPYFAEIKELELYPFTSNPKVTH
ncbi:MAG: DUF3822 family protein [Draconibacterium sp.]|nr:DUF3822 family protein [Draconibacterium sp.]